MAVMHVAGKHTGDKLVQLHIVPAFENKAELLAEKISDLLWPYLRSHPITYNASFDRRTVKANGHKYAEKIREISGDINTPPDLILAAEAMDQAETYYDIARNIFIDNVATLAIERWLLDDLPSLIPSQTVWTLTNEDIEKIAAEPFEFREKRRRLTQQVAALQEAMRICRRHARHRVTDDRLSNEPAIVVNGGASDTLPRTRTGHQWKERVPSTFEGFGSFGEQRFVFGAQEGSSTAKGGLGNPPTESTDHSRPLSGGLSSNLDSPPPTSMGKEKPNGFTGSFRGPSPNGANHDWTSYGGFGRSASAQPPATGSLLGGPRSTPSSYPIGGTASAKEGGSLFEPS